MMLLVRLRRYNEKVVWDFACSDRIEASFAKPLADLRHFVIVGGDDCVKSCCTNPKLNVLTMCGLLEDTLYYIGSIGEFEDGKFKTILSAIRGVHKERQW